MGSFLFIRDCFLVGARAAPAPGAPPAGPRTTSTVDEVFGSIQQVQQIDGEEALAEHIARLKAEEEAAGDEAPAGDGAAAAAGPPTAPASLVFANAVAPIPLDSPEAAAALERIKAEAEAEGSAAESEAEAFERAVEEGKAAAAARAAAAADESTPGWLNAPLSQVSTGMEGGTALLDESQEEEEAQPTAKELEAEALKQRLRDEYIAANPGAADAPAPGQPAQGDWFQAALSKGQNLFTTGIAAAGNVAKASKEALDVQAAKEAPAADNPLQVLLRSGSRAALYKKLDQCIEAGDMDGAAAVKKRIDEL